jgi:hypothetical protein
MARPTLSVVVLGLLQRMVHAFPTARLPRCFRDVHEHATSASILRLQAREGVGVSVSSDSNTGNTLQCGHARGPVNRF